jgi:hypothetical protein
LSPTRKSGDILEKSGTRPANFPVALSEYPFQSGPVAFELLLIVTLAPHFEGRFLGAITAWIRTELNCDGKVCQRKFLWHQTI